MIGFRQRQQRMLRRRLRNTNSYSADNKKTRGNYLEEDKS
jgi:hypothetical protein